MQQSKQAETLAVKTARELARMSLGTDEGEFLGAEDDLLTQLGVSRPTLRQAAKIVESDRLVSVRRGVKGGFYAARPDAADAIRTLARYLRMKGGTLTDILVVSRLVSEEAAARACQCEDEVMRRRLEDFLSSVEDNDSPGAMIKAESELVETISKMSGNPAIELVMAIGFSFGREEREVELYRDPEHREIARGLHRQLCLAILDRDEEIARVIMRRRSATMLEWLGSQSGVVK
ncbi:GntR family transcriptional repressor for pyruvate dehydrogenase complex [Porphyrobacter sp. MBR-155]|jgi:DNA-binding FadR family transcriptional regulator|uniref:FadR/GntR family transcriptional regulator n=1 Tax=Porphyrobacter sp. MBR-155 TaxID=3156464 RepID=UPI0033917F9F